MATAQILFTIALLCHPRYVSSFFRTPVRTDHGRRGFTTITRGDGAYSGAAGVKSFGG